MTIKQYVQAHFKLFTGTSSLRTQSNSSLYCKKERQFNVFRSKAEVLQVLVLKIQGFWGVASGIKIHIERDEWKLEALKSKTVVVNDQNKI